LLYKIYFSVRFEALTVVTENYCVPGCDPK